jgi:hypothetical protein
MGRLIKTHNAFHQRAFSSSIFSQKSMKCGWLQVERNIVKGYEGTEPLGHSDNFQIRWANQYG